MKRIAYAALFSGMAIVGTVGCQKESAPKLSENPPRVSENRSSETPLRTPSEQIDKILDPASPTKESKPTTPPAVVTPSPEKPTDAKGRGVGGAGPSPRGQDRTRMALPKADMTVIHNYRTEIGNLAELEGVCKVTEDSVECWKADGSRNEDLANKIKASFSSERAYYSPVSIRYGRKNRLVIFKMTQHMSRGMNENLSLQTIGADPYGNYASLDLGRNDGNFQAGDPMISYQSRFVSEDKTTTTTKARFSLFKPIDENVSIDCKVGALATFGGETFTIMSIKKGSSRSSFAGMNQMASQVWTVKVKTAGKASRPISINFQAQDASGKPISFIDERGEPVSAERYREEMTKYQEKMMESYRNNKPGARLEPRQGPKIRSAMGGHLMSRSPSGELEIEVYVNPARVSKFAISGGTSQTVEITDIPLDPR